MKKPKIKRLKFDPSMEMAFDNMKCSLGMITKTKHSDEDCIRTLLDLRKHSNLRIKRKPRTKRSLMFVKNDEQ